MSPELLIAAFKGIVDKADGWELFARSPLSASLSLCNDQTLLDMANITFLTGKKINK